MDEIDKDRPNTGQALEDSQEELYAKAAQSEGDKFDSRLFWLTGGITALSLGYFQATGTLYPDYSLVIGYGLLLFSIAILLIGLQVSSTIYGNLAVRYRERSNCKLESDEIAKVDQKINSADWKIRWILPAINYMALLATLTGSILIIIYMFQSVQS